MNLNSLRKNYDTLSFRERYSLYQMASVRRDESEINAVVLASPKSNYTQVDFAFFDEKVLILQLENIFERLDHSIRFDLFLNARDKTDEKLTDGIFSSGYLYTIETDAWKVVGDEFGFDVEGFREGMAADYLPIRMMSSNDEMMRKLAFTEEGMRKIAADKNFDSSGLKTLKTQTEKYREILTAAEDSAA